MTPKAYIAKQSVLNQKIIKNLIRTIESEVPMAWSKMSYGIICYWHHYMLIGFGVKKKDCVSFYSMRNGILDEMENELIDISWKGSTIHLYPNIKFPEQIIRKIIKQRLLENQERYDSKTDR